MEKKKKKENKNPVNIVELDVKTMLAFIFIAHTFKTQQMIQKSKKNTVAYNPSV